VGKLILHMITSVDGFIADRHGRVNPETQWDTEMQRFYLDLFSMVDGLVFGRNLFDQYFGHWKKVALGHLPAASDLERKWTQRLLEMPKYVLSMKLEKSDDENTTVIRGGIGEEITKLKVRSPRGLLLMCGPSLCAHLTSLGLIDEYMFYMCPNVVGQGVQLFRDIPDYVKLKFEKSLAFKAGVNLHYYSTAGRDRTNS
jgi:dihydrofolate reductase